MSNSVNRIPSEPTAWDKIKGLFIGNILTSVDEMQRLMPDSLLFGSLILYLLTHNFAFGVFALFLTESSLLHRLISFIFEKSIGESKLTPEQRALACRVGYHTPRIAFERIFAADKYPSLGSFSIAAVATYLGSAMGAFKETLDTMGTDWQARYSVAISFIVVLTALFLLVRYIRGCESGGEMAVAVGLGVAVGAGLYFAHNAIFGPDSMNFLGLPFLINKATEGNPIYVCAATKAN